ncbi:hypothetical protein SIN8267_02901 [Sinobacterium norvegicum]|uniref:Uncharacterized protein n=1 Tax=Sinobacterium norvegicum TaxID=1641715 RepID=A0ABN8EKZ3_9GAMM|nr:hypothetical protein [Sinobacterium norvegicum]CAH0992764.1 hypothetical protein SIN8267_02901 [Sinobacterium norvegicum]
MDTAMVIVEPHLERQPALARAIDCAKLHQQSLHIHSFLPQTKNPSEFSEQYQEAEDSLRYYVNLARNKNINSDFTISTERFESALVNSMSNHNNYCVLFQDFVSNPWSLQLFKKHPVVRWMLDSPCSINIIKGVHSWRDMRLLVNVENSNDGHFHKYLFSHEMEAGAVAKRLGAEVFYLVNYHDSLHYPNRRWILDHYNIDNSKVIFKSGDLGGALVDVARTIGSTAILTGVPSSRDHDHNAYEHALQTVLEKSDNDVMILH